MALNQNLSRLSNCFVHGKAEPAVYYYPYGVDNHSGVQTFAQTIEAFQEQSRFWLRPHLCVLPLHKKVVRPSFQPLYFPERTYFDCPGEILGLTEYSEISTGKHSDWEGLGVNGHLERGSSRAPGQCLTQELLANSFLHLQSGDKKNLACWPCLTLISSSGWMWNVYSLHAGVDLLWSSISAFSIICYKWLIVLKHYFPFVF